MASGGARNGLNIINNMANRNNARPSLLVLVLAGLVVLTLVGLFVSNNLREVRAAWFLGGCTAPSTDADNAAVHTTVVYLYRGDDEMYPDNLNFFLRHGVRDGDGNRYYVVFPQEAADRSLLQGKNVDSDTIIEDGSSRWCTCSLGCPKGKDKVTTSSQRRQLRQWNTYYRGTSKPYDDDCPCKCPTNMTTMALPRNVIFVYHEIRSSSSSSNSSSACVSGMVSTLGELMQGDGGGHHIPTSSSTYYLLLDSTVRGPFLPLYLSDYAVTPTTENEVGGRGSLFSSSPTSWWSKRCVQPYRWTDAFTSRVTETVKLVGATIACSPSPHVSSHVLAMDAVGLGIVLQTARTSACSQLNQAITSLSSDTYIKDKGSAKDIDVSRELMGVSQAILRTNYRIDSLMMQHQGAGCLSRSSRSLDRDSSSDGVVLNPLEQIFIPVNRQIATGGGRGNRGGGDLGPDEGSKQDYFHANNGVLVAMKYDQWMSQRPQGGDTRQRARERARARRRAISLNGFEEERERRVVDSTHRLKIQCFNMTSYRDENYDLKALNFTPGQLFQHYLAGGQFQARPGVMFSC